MISSQDTPKFAYLRNRPFLVVEVYLNPAVTKSQDRTRTERKDWMKDKRNVTRSEHPRVVNRITDKHLTHASIIIDLLRDTIIKNRLDQSDEDVLTLYKQQYASIIEQGRTGWANRATPQDFETAKRSHMKAAHDRAESQIVAPVTRAVSRKV